LTEIKVLIEHTGIPAITRYLESLAHVRGEVLASV